MMFCLYELAQNPQVQEQLQQEIDKVLARHDGEVTYEGIQEMEYMDMVVSETLRKYPPVPVYLRECTKDYRIPGKDVIIEKGTPVMVPIYGVQNDPDYFPQPERFDPQRFSPEEKAKRDHYTSILFGEGPRICIGERFGLMQTKVGLTVLLSKYKFGVSPETPIPLKFDPTAFILTPAYGMNLKVSLR